MEDPNADTEWNEILRNQGILPPLPKKAPPPEEKIVSREDKVSDLSLRDLTETIECLEDGGLGEDEDEVRFLEEYRRKRMAEFKESAALNKFGSVREITKSDWTVEVNDAAKGVYVVIHIAGQGKPDCALLDMRIKSLAPRFPAVKFLRGESTMCIPNYPDGNLPTILIYCNGDLKNQLIGKVGIGAKVLNTDTGLESRLGELGVLKSTVKESDRNAITMTVHGARIGRQSNGKSDSSNDSD